MKMETFRQQVGNVYVEGEKSVVDATVWHSLEGCNLMVTSKPECAVKLAASLTWEEVDMLLVALNAARSA